MERLSAHPFLYRAPSYSLPCIQCAISPRRNTPLLYTLALKLPIHCTNSPRLLHRTIQVIKKNKSNLPPKEERDIPESSLPALRPRERLTSKTPLSATNIVLIWQSNTHTFPDSPPISPDHSSDPLNRTLTTSLIPLPTLTATYTHRFTPPICICPSTSTYLLNHLYVSKQSLPRTSSTIYTHLRNLFHVASEPFIRTCVTVGTYLFNKSF